LTENKREAARKIARFRENIIQRVNAECDEITRSIEELRESEFARFRSDAESSENAQLEENKRKIKTSCQRDTANRKQELKAEYNAHREKLRAELFDGVRAKLAEFSTSGEYSEWLLKKAEPYKTMTLYARSSDTTKLNGFDVKPDDSVTKLGGFIAVGNGVRADETFERLLSEQEDWFLNEFASAE
jgi:hypothetical protein